MFCRCKDVVDDLQQKMTALTRDREDTQKHLERCVHDIREDPSIVLEHVINFYVMKLI